MAHMAIISDCRIKPSQITDRAPEIRGETMKSLRIVLLLCVMALALPAFAQSTPKPAPPISDAEKAFRVLKTLDGSWEGTIKLNPPMAGMENAAMVLTLRIASHGRSFVHEMHGASYDPFKNPGKED